MKNLGKIALKEYVRCSRDALFLAVMRINTMSTLELCYLCFQLFHPGPKLIFAPHVAFLPSVHFIQQLHFFSLER